MQCDTLEAPIPGNILRMLKNVGRGEPMTGDIAITISFECQCSGKCSVPSNSPVGLSRGFPPGIWLLIDIFGRHNFRRNNIKRIVKV